MWWCGDNRAPESGRSRVNPGSSGISEPQPHSAKGCTPHPALPLKAARGVTQLPGVGQASLRDGNGPYLGPHCFKKQSLCSPWALSPKGGNPRSAVTTENVGGRAVNCSPPHPGVPRTEGAIWEPLVPGSCHEVNSPPGPWVVHTLPPISSSRPHPGGLPLSSRCPQSSLAYQGGHRV